MITATQTTANGPKCRIARISRIKLTMTDAPYRDWVATIARVLLLEFIERMDERLGNEHAAVGPEVTVLVGEAIGEIIHLHCAPHG